MGVLPSSPWQHFQNEGVSLEWVKSDPGEVTAMAVILYSCTIQPNLFHVLYVESSEIDVLK